MARNERRGVKKGKVEVLPRGQRQDAEQAMGSDPINAIIELVTNCDDAYRALSSGRREKIRIEVERHRQEPTRIIVKDRAGGMTAEELEQRLSKVGGRTSGFETGAERRGLFGRGAKDVVHFGPARWESVKNGTRSYLELINDGRFTGEFEVGVLGKSPGERHGTEAILSVHRNFLVPNHETLLRKLRNHYALRPMLLDSKREVTLVDLSQDRSDKVRFYPPKTVLLEEKKLEIPGYEDYHVDLQLYEASETLSEESDSREYWQHSILITSGHASYEIFEGGKFSREPYAFHLRRIFGYASVPGISSLIRAIDDAEEYGTGTDRRNPVRLVRRDRHGLVSRRDHPFVNALYTVLEEALEPHLERLRKAAEEAAGDISEETRRRWDRAGRALAKLMNENALGEGIEGNLPPLGLTLIPTVRIVEPGDAARLLIRYRLRQDDQIDGAYWPVDIVETDDEEGHHAPVSMNLEPRNDYFSRTYIVAGRDDGAMSEVVVRSGSDEVNAIIHWRHRSPSPVEDFEFERASFSIKNGQERRVTLLAPWDVVMDAGDQVHFSIDGDSRITLPDGLTSVFTYDEIRDAGMCRIRVRGQGVGARARLTAELGDEIAEAELAVTSAGVSGIRVEFTESTVEQRAWLNMDAGVLYINTSDRTVQRYVGPKRDKWPGRDSVPFNVMLAELMVDAAARYQLQREENEVQDASILFRRREELVRKWLPSIHRALVTDTEHRKVRGW